MEWLGEILFSHSAIQALIVLSVLCACGLALGKVKLWGISLGATMVFFIGILAGTLGISIDGQILRYVQDFGLVLFVYALGVQVGPGFFNSLHHSGIRLNMLALALVVLGTVMAAALPWVSSIALPEAIGVLCGATTNTPALGAAQQTLDQLGVSANGAALGCAVTYPLGVVGVILALVLMRKWIVKPDDLTEKSDDEGETTFIAAYQVFNPGVFGKTIGEVATLTHAHFVISRLWRDGKVTIPSAETMLEQADRLLVISTEDQAPALAVLFGRREDANWNKTDIDWDAIDNELVSRAILVTKAEVNGKRLGSLKLRKHYGVNISRIIRNGVQLLATPDIHLMMGDRLVVVGQEQAVQNVESVLGNAVESLNEPRLISVFAGMTLGLILGSIPIMMPGMSMPVRLGLAGGPIIMGIIMGYFGPRIHINSYTTQSANLMLRAIGLALYLACLGLDAGVDFLPTVMRPEGLLWIAAGIVLTVLPVLIVGILALRWLKFDFPTISGLLTGAMANPMALNYANDTLSGERPSVVYATVYPLSMFARVILVQVVLLTLM